MLYCSIDRDIVNPKLPVFGSDDDEPIPIVPISEEHEDAMEDPDFKSLLKKIGIKPPANEQVSMIMKGHTCRLIMNRSV